MSKQREVINIIDVKSEAIYRSDDPLRFATADLGGARSFAAIPMLAADRLVGAFTIYRQTVRPFSDDTLRLAQLFAAQSVIALENVDPAQPAHDPSGRFYREMTDEPKI